MEENIDLLKNLNNQQKIAVSNKNNYLLVIAGAGSGKTKLLIHRIAWLIKIKKHNPSSIMALTFTNKAANEMNNRIKNIIGLEHKKILIGTFHSICYRILRTYYKESNLSSNFQVIDNKDQIRILKKIIKSLNIDNKQYTPEKAMLFINNKKNQGLQPENIIINNSKKQKKLLEIYFFYQEQCNKLGVIDFGELLLRTKNLFVKNINILTYYKKKFKNILIDEFQDTNEIQYSWIKLLLCKNSTVLIVGDDDQSIYTWRGANIDNINRFIKEFPNTKIIYLEQNYRSTSNILNAANQLISNNKNRFCKKLWTNCDSGNFIKIYKSFNEKNESKFVIHQIKLFKMNGGNFNNCAILYRNNFQSRILEETLIKNNIFYVIYGGMRFFERKEIKDALSYLRIIINHNDDLAYERILNFPPRGIGKKTIELIKKTAKNNISLYQATKKIIYEKLLSQKTIINLQEFLILIKKIKKEIKNLTLTLQIDKVIKKSGLIHFYEIKKDNVKIENLKELINAASEFSISHINNNSNKYFYDLENFLSLKILDSEMINNHEFESVKLMTVHSSKGLEFDQVFMVGMEEGLFPSFKSLNNIETLEEERRLAYVGITRAINQLTLTYSKSRLIYGKIKNLLKSRFIKELPLQYIQKINFHN